MSLSSNFPTIRPSLLLDFANVGLLDPRVTFTRASTATYFNSLGVLTTAQNNEARFDYNPSTLAPRGLLIEEQRTNGIRNNTMQGAVAGTPGTAPTNWGIDTPGLTTSVIGAGTQNGVTYIDISLNGTTSAGYGNIFFEPTNGIAATNNQTWAHSLWLSVVGGSTTNISAVRHAFDLYSSVPAYLATVASNLVGVSATQTRYSAALTTNNASTAFVRPSLSLLWASGAAIDITLRIGLPQLELGAFATSVIPTTTTALTRNADVATMTGTNFSSWYNASEGTLLAQWVTAASDGANNRGIVAVDDGTNNNRVAQFLPLSAAPLSVAGRVASGGVATNPANSGSIALSSVAKSVLAYGVGTNQAALCVNGGTVTTASPAAAPVSLTVFRIGTIFGVNNIGGWVQRIAYYPVRLASSQLQALTS